MSFRIKKLSVLGLLAGIAVIIGYAESLLPPIFFAVPYAKLGLSNAVVLLTLVLFGWKEGLLILLIKCGFSALFAGNPFMLVYSLCGGLLAFGGMWALLLVHKNSLSGIGAVGGMLHNVGQVCVAAVITKSTAVFLFLPHLTLFGAMAGIITGAICHLLVKRAVPHTFLTSDNSAINVNPDVDERVAADTSAVTSSQTETNAEKTDFLTAGNSGASNSDEEGQNINGINADVSIETCDDGESASEKNIGE